MKIPAMPIMMSPGETPAKVELKLPAFNLPTFKPLPVPSEAKVNEGEKMKSPVLMSPLQTFKAPTFTGLPTLKSPLPVSQKEEEKANIPPPLPVSSSKPVVFTMPKVASLGVTAVKNTDVTSEVPVEQKPFTSVIPPTSVPKFPSLVSPRMSEIKEILPSVKVTLPTPPASIPLLPTSPITPSVPPSVKLPSPKISINLPVPSSLPAMQPVVLLPKVVEKEELETNLQIAQEGAKDAEFVNEEASFQEQETESLPGIPQVFSAPSVSLPSLGGVPVPLPSVTGLPKLSIPALPPIASPAPMTNLPAISLPSVKPVEPLPISIPQEKQTTKEKKETEQVISFKPTITSIANLPSPSSRKTNEPSPKIKIPKVKGVAVKKVKKGDNYVQPLGGSIMLPTSTTIVPEIPISPPSASVIKPQLQNKAVIEASQVMENIKDIDLSRLTDERVNKKSGVTPYSINELKTLAAALNLAKTGNKKDLVDRIKSYVLKYNPSAFD